MPAFIHNAYSFTATFKNSETDAVIDVTSYDFGLRFYRPSDCCYPISLTPGEGIATTDQATGVIVFSLTPSQTACIGTGSMSVILYKNYSSETTRSVLASGSEVFLSQRFDAGGGPQTLRLRPNDPSLRILIS